MREKDDFIKWVKEHRKELLAVGIGVGVLIAVIISIRNKEVLFKMWNILKQAIVPAKTVPVSMTPLVIKGEESVVVKAMERAPFDVSAHIRQLPDGYKHSIEKVAEALEHGIELLENQTWVSSYTKGGMAA